MYSQTFLNRSIIVATIILCCGITVMAQGTLSQALTEVNDELSNARVVVTTIIFSLAGIFLLIGGIRVYNKMNQGKDVWGDIVLFGGGILFLLAVNAVATQLFP